MDHRVQHKTYYTGEEFDSANLVWGGLVGVAMGALGSMLKAHRERRLLDRHEASFVQAGFEKCVAVLKELFGEAYGQSALAALLDPFGVPDLPADSCGAMVSLTRRELTLLEDLARNAWVWTAAPRDCQAVVASLVQQFKDGMERATPTPHERTDSCPSS
jgi:hypothetical protein